MKKEDGVIIDFDVVLPKAGQRVTDYADFLLRLQSKSQFFDRNLGYVSWLQGKVLIMAREECKKKGSWSKFLGSIDVAPGKTLSPETAAKLRKIASVVVESQARVKSYSEMLKMAYPSYAKELKKDAEDDNVALFGRKKKSKGRRDEASKEPFHPEKYQKTLRNILSSSQLLKVGMAEVGMSPTDEIDHCRDCIRLADSAINELQTAKSICQAAIDKYPTQPRKAA